jgi:hypothetical protein
MAFDATLTRTQRHCCLPREFGVWHHLPHALRRRVAWLWPIVAQKADMADRAALLLVLLYPRGRCWRRGASTVLAKMLRRGMPTTRMPTHLACG